MGFFSDRKVNVGEHRGAGGGLYFKPGTFVCRLDGLKIKPKTQQSGEAFIAEFTVLQSNTEEMAPASKPNIFVKLSGENFEKYESTYLGNVADCARGILACRMAMFGEPVKPEDVDLDDDTLDAMIEGKDDFDMIGTIVGVEAYNVTARTGNTITKHKFFVPENLQDFLEETAA